MSSEQARAYFEQFMGEMEASRQRLARMLREQGADASLALDLTPGSLDQMWDTLCPLLAWQDGWKPDEMRPESQPTLRGLGDPGNLPSWLDPVGGPIDLSPTSLWIVDGVGRHLGNLLVATVPGMRWNVGHHRIRAYVDQNRPVVTDREGEDFNPILAVTVVVSKKLKGLTNGPSTPRHLYEVRASSMRPIEAELPASAHPADATESVGGELAEVARVIVPFASSDTVRASTDKPVTVADLFEAGALAVEEVEGEPDRWMMWFGDETRLHYEDNAPFGLEEVLASVPGLTNVIREDRETILVTAPNKSAEALLVIAARALLDDRVRKRNASA